MFLFLFLIWGLQFFLIYWSASPPIQQVNKTIKNKSYNSDLGSNIGPHVCLAAKFSERYVFSLYFSNYNNGELERGMIYIVKESNIFRRAWN